MDINKVKRQVKQFESTLKRPSEMTYKERAEAKSRVKKIEEDKDKRRVLWPQIQKHKGKLILKGKGVSPGIAMGKVFNIQKRTPEIMTRIKPGDIVVADTLKAMDDDYIQKAAGFVTDTGGGQSGSLAILAREWDKPAITLTLGEGYAATEILTTGQIIVIDGTKGIVYEYRDT